MSDSDDDNVYDDYLESRRAARQKNRQPVQTYESDSDDDFKDKKASPVAKKKKEEDILLGDSDEESFVQKVETNDQESKNKIVDFEEEYRKKLLSNDGLIHIHNDRNDALSKTMKIVKTLDNAVRGPKTPEPEIVEEVGVSDTSTNTLSFPVTVIIVDYESRLDLNEVRIRRDVPLESTFFEVRKELADKWKCRLDDVMLSCNGVKIESHTTPNDLGLRPLQVSQCIDAIKRRGEDKNEVIIVENVPDYITLKVQLKDRRKPMYIKANDNTTIQNIKQIVFDTLSEEGEITIPIEKMRLNFDDEFLTNMEETCKQLEFEDADCIDIYY